MQMVTGKRGDRDRHITSLNRTATKSFIRTVMCEKHLENVKVVTHRGGWWKNTSVIQRFKKFKENSMVGTK